MPVFAYSCTLQIDDVEIGFVPGSLTIDDTGFGRKIMTFTTRSDAPYLHIEKKVDAVLNIGGNKVFDGVTWSVKKRRVFENKGLQQQVVCVDYGKFTERTPMNEPAPSRSLEDAVTASIANMGGHGVSLDPAQETGPTVPVDEWAWMSVRKIHERLTAQTGWVPRWDGPLIRFVEPGTTASPFDINDTDQNWISIETFSTLENYFNQVWLRYGPQGLTQVIERHYGNGTTHDYPLRATLVLAGGGNATQSGLVATNIGGSPANQSIDVDPVSGTALWHFDVDTNTLIRDAGESTLGPTDYVEITFTAQFPQQVVDQVDAEVIANGLFSAIIDDASIVDSTIAASRVIELMEQLGGEQQNITIHTNCYGLEPTQALPVEIGDFELDGSYLILRTLVKHIENTPAGHIFDWEANCLLGSDSKDNWQQFWRELAQSTGGTGGTTLPPVVVPPESIFPVRRSRTSGNSGSTNVTSHGITLPTYAEGDTLLVIFAVGFGGTSSVDTGLSSSGWSQVFQNSTSITCHQAVYTKVAGPPGSENLVLTTSAADRSTFIADAIQYGGTVSATSIDESNNDFDPPSHVAGVTANFLWYVIRSCFGNTFTASAAPANFDNLFSVTGDSSAALSDVADRSLGGVNSLNPGTFTSGGAGSAVGICTTLSIQRA